MDKNLTNIKPLLIDEDDRLKILNFLRTNLGGIDGKCFFRRIEHVVSKSDPLLIQKFSTPEKSKRLDNLSGLSHPEIFRYIEINYRSFHCITSPRDIRSSYEPVEVVEKEIFLHSDRYNQIDMSSDYTFTFSKDHKHHIPTTPCSGDLAFIFISNKEIENFIKCSQNIPERSTKGTGDSSGVSQSKKESKNKKCLPRATYWCVASDQFLRAWTAIMFDWHETFDKFLGSAINETFVEIKDCPNSSSGQTPASVAITQKYRNDILKDKLFCGNKLMTNSWLKYKLSLKFNNIEFTEEESEKRFWISRSEFVSKRWVDVYCALVLIARYGELPCPVNVPNNNDDKPKRYFWHLPEELISMLFSRALIGRNITSELVINHNVWAKMTKAKDVMLTKSVKGKAKLGFLDEIPKCRYDTIDSKNLAENKLPLRKKNSIFEKKINVNDFPILQPTNKQVFPQNTSQSNKAAENWVEVVKTSRTDEEPPTINSQSESSVQSEQITSIEVGQQFRCEEAITLSQSEYPKIGPKVQKRRSVESSKLMEVSTISDVKELFYCENVPVTTIKIKEINLQNEDGKVIQSNDVASIKLEVTIDVPKGKSSWSKQILENVGGDDW